MKKFGFTLMEVIVAMGIVGVVAAITAPMVENIMPDKDKVTVLKVYKTIIDVNSEIKNDGTKYSLYFDESRNADHWPYIQDINYAIPFLSFLNVVQMPDDAVLNVTRPRNLNFDTIDGVHWIMDFTTVPNYAEITIDSGDTRKQAGVYSANNNRPRNFRFYVKSTNLQVEPGDPLTDAFISNSGRLNGKKYDRRAAQEKLQSGRTYPFNP